MFEGCRNLEEIGEIEEWEISVYANIFHMYYDCNLFVCEEILGIIEEMMEWDGTKWL